MFWAKDDGKTPSTREYAGVRTQYKCVSKSLKADLKGRFKIKHKWPFIKY